MSRGNGVGGGKMGAGSSQRAAGASSSMSAPGRGQADRPPNHEGFIAKYDGFPADRMLQVAGMVGSVLSGSVTGLVTGMAQETAGGMTPPDGFAKFGKANDTMQGQYQRRAKRALQVGTALGNDPQPLGA